MSVTNITDRFPFKVITSVLDDDGCTKLDKWCEDNIGQLDVDWTGYFCKFTDGTRAMVYVANEEHSVLLKMTWK